MTDTFLTIATESIGLFKDKGSKFIAYAYPVSTEAEIKEHLEDLRKEHHGARHHCYAYRLGADKLNFRANDDGEPSSTAGKPILGQIVSRDLSNILIVVVRYFGGTLLGVSGLINAYKNASSDALDNANIITATVENIIEIEFDYLAMNDIMKIVKDAQLSIKSQSFEAICRINVACKASMTEQIVAKLQKINSTKINII